MCASLAEVLRVAEKGFVTVEGLLDEDIARTISEACLYKSRCQHSRAVLARYPALLSQSGRCLSTACLDAGGM